jgi:DNA polymerase IV
LVEELCYDLRKSGFCACCITVKIRYSNFDTFTKQLNIQMSASDMVMMKHVLELFDKLYERRILIRLVGVRFNKLVRGTEQLNLFDGGSKIAPLYQAMDKIRDRYGTHAIGRALNTDLNKRHPNPSLIQNHAP